MGFLRHIIYCVCLLLAGMALACPETGRSATLKADANLLRAVFTQRFIKYVTWPSGRASGAQADAPVVVAATDARALRRYFTRPDIRLAQWPVKDCQVLVIIGTNARTTGALLKRVRGKPILTVGQDPNFARMGGMINFVPFRGRMRFQINIEAVRKAGLTISSRLLKLADIYQENPGPSQE